MFFDNTFKKKVDVEVKAKLKKSLTGVFSLLTKEVNSALEEIGQSPDDYNLQIYPWSLSRKDGKPVPESVLKIIQKRLSKKI